MKKETFAVGSLVTFHFSWFGKTNPHDKHKCRVLEAWVERRGIKNTSYYRYVLEDLDKNLAPRAKKVFKVTDSSSNGTTLSKA